MSIPATYVRDLAERVLATFLGAFAATLIAANWFTVSGVQDTSLLGQAGIAGVAAVLSLAKGLVARLIGSAGTASLDPGLALTSRAALPADSRSLP